MFSGSTLRIISRRAGGRGLASKNADIPPPKRRHLLARRSPHAHARVLRHFARAGRQSINGAPPPATIPVRKAAALD